MVYQPLEELLPKSGFSVYKLIRMASNRAMELADGKPKLIEKSSSEKLATIALEEIRAAKVVLKDVAGDFVEIKEKDSKEKGSKEKAVAAAAK